MASRKVCDKNLGTAQKREAVNNKYMKMRDFQRKLPYFCLFPLKIRIIYIYLQRIYKVAL